VLTFLQVKRMKPIVWVGILLIVAGGLALAYQGFGYTRQEKVLDLGPIHATREDHEWVSIPPVLGGLALVGGIALLVVGGRKRS
jgi:drug/metabolite transporter (DMT)-like permease